MLILAASLTAPSLTARAPEKPSKVQTASDTVKLPKMTPAKPRKTSRKDATTSLEGTTGLVLHVGAKGQLIDARIVQSSGNLLVDDAALMAMKAAKFEPGTVRGKAATLCYRIDYTAKVID